MLQIESVKKIPTANQQKSTRMTPLKPISYFKIAALGLASLAITTSSQAVSLLTSAGTGNGFPGSIYSVGYSFTLSSAYTVEALGLFDEGGAGFSSSNYVALYDNSGTLLADVTFAAGTYTVDAAGFTFATPAFGAGIELAANTTYVLAASATGGSDYVRYNANTTQNPVTAEGVTLIESRYGTINGYANNSLGAGSFVGPNLELQAVPEPSTWAMLVGGLGLLAFGQRMHRRTA